jgi:hypothetical protein
MHTTHPTDAAAPAAEVKPAIAKLPEIITHLLKEQGVAVPYAWAAGIHPDALHEEPRIQMFQCARHWTTILSLSQEDTRFARYCLTSAPSVRVWLQSFTTLVVPLYLKILQAQSAHRETVEQAMGGVSERAADTAVEVIGID